MFQYSLIVRAPLLEWSNLLQLLSSFTTISSFSLSVLFIFDTIWRAAGTPSMELELSMLSNLCSQVLLQNPARRGQARTDPEVLFTSAGQTQLCGDNKCGEGSFTWLAGVKSVRSRSHEVFGESFLSPRSPGTKIKGSARTKIQLLYNRVVPCGLICTQFLVINLFVCRRQEVPSQMLSKAVGMCRVIHLP